MPVIADIFNLNLHSFVEQHSLFILSYLQITDCLVNLFIPFLIPCGKFLFINQFDFGLNKMGLRKAT